MLVDIQEGGDNLAALPLADLLAALPKPERRRFNREWRFARESFAALDQVIRRPIPGLEQAEALAAFLIWRLRLIRCSIRRARLGHTFEGTES